MPRFLFTVGHDVKFITRDKIEAWALDMATASLALWGLMFDAPRDSVSNGYMRLWRQLASLFWGEPEDYAPEWEPGFLRLDLKLLDAADVGSMLKNFDFGRKTYIDTLERLELLPSNIRTAFERPQLHDHGSTPSEQWSTESLAFFMSLAYVEV